MRAIPTGSPDIADVHRRLEPARRRLAALDGVTLDWQIALARIPAPTGEEGARARWMLRALEDMGIAATTDAAGNVRAEIPGDAALAPVVVCAHLDTVFPPDVPLEVRREGTRVIGPGINDNARGIAATLAIARELASGGTRTLRPVVIVGTVGEEGTGDLRGAKHLFSDRRDVAAAIVIDGAGDDRIVHQALGARRFRIDFHGDGGHSWAAFGAPNAAHAAAVCGAALARVPLPAVPRAALTVGRLGGGTSVNAIPEHAWLEVDARSTDRGALDRLEAEVRRAVVAAKSEENARRRPGAAALHATIATIGDRPSGEVPRDDPLVRLAAAATRLVGCVPAFAVASTDANVPIALGIPAVAIGGGGRGGDAHTVNEWFENHEGPRGIARALSIVVAAAGLAAVRDEP